VTFLLGDVIFLWRIYDNVTKMTS